MESSRAVAGIDPHKHSATIAVVDGLGRLTGCASFVINPDGINDMLTLFLDTELVIERIGVEGSASLGRPVVVALAAAGYDVREVQPNRTAERRRRRRRAKTDNEDSEAIARETLADPQLPPAGKRHAPDPQWQALTAIRDWRGSLVLQRVRLLNEAEAVLVSLPVALRCALPATSRVLPQLKALGDGTISTDGLAVADLIKLDRLAATLEDVTKLTRRIKDLDQQIPALLTELGCTLNAICGIGVVTAMDLLSEIGDPMRFQSEAQFARWCGAAPVALSSGEGNGPVLRHRPRPGRQSIRQLDPAHRARHPGPLSSASQGLHGPMHDGTENKTVGPSKPQTPARQRDHPAHVDQRPERAAITNNAQPAAA